MSLSAGTRLGPYEILTSIGAGGMGEVYKARDTRLGRIVAVKVSHEQFSQRFEREARAVAALNHPHICQLYDVGPDYLVMELVEGQQLRGPLPIEKAVEYAGQILEALDAAHQKGITHRDLKPANILVTKQGIKLLDFGLAKFGAPLKESDATVTELTSQGHIVGTLQYMSPEQLQGKGADARSDLFAFGCVLREMLTGKRTFEGPNKASVVAAILEREPAPLVEAPPLERVVKRCLAKDPDQRFQTARDLKAALSWALEQASIAKPRQDRLGWIAAAIAVAMVSGLGGWFMARNRVSQPQAESPLMRFAIQPPENTNYRGGQISPDGRSVALFGVESSNRKQLWLRRLDSLTAQPLAGATEGDPFWSPDSRFVAFHQDGKLKKIDVSGGAPQTICESELLVGGSWSRDGTIIFGNGDQIVQVPAKGGIPRPLTTFDASRSETMQAFPSFLPDGRHFVYTIHSEKRENGGIYLSSLDSPKEARIRLLEDVANAVYAPASPSDPSSGYLLFPRGEVLMAQRFSARDLQLKGEAFSVVEKIARSASNISASFSASQDGLLFINPTTIYGGDRLTWFDRAGKRLGSIGDPGLHFQPQLSPDRATVVYDQIDAESFVSTMWLVPMARGAASRFTFTGSMRPLWSPDGRRIAYVAYTKSTNALYAKTVEGAGKEELLLESGGMPDRILCDWSKDGSLLYSQPDKKSGWDLWLLRLSGSGKPTPFLRTEFNERCGAFSPDGKWIGYASDESGKSEIYVQAFHGEGAGSERKWQVSYGGGTWPKWRRDSKELLYLSADRKVMAVDLKPGATFQPGTPQPLFTTGIYTPDGRFEVTADGQRFLIPTAFTEENAAPPTVVLNWTKGVKP